VIVCLLDIGGIVDNHCLIFLFIIHIRRRHDRDRMVVEFTATYAISAYHH